MRHGHIGHAIAATLLSVPFAAQASPSPQLAYSDLSAPDAVVAGDPARPLSDPQLAQVRGGYGYQRWQLTPAAMTTILDSQSRLELASSAEIGGVMMDNWWNDVGAQLILTSATLPR